VLGVQEAIGDLNRALKEKKDKINDSIHKAGFMVEAEIKASIAGQRAETRSVDTGRFLNSITTNNARELESTITSTVYYGKYLEYGTSRIKPRRHFQNSGERKKSEIISMIKTSIN